MPFLRRNGRIAGIDTTFKADTIDHYEVLRPILERYEDMRRAMGDNPDDIANMIEWLRGREQYDLALKETNRLLAIDPTHPDGKRLTVVCGNQTALTEYNTTRVPPVWGEDHLLPRIPDGNGFMKGVMGPGGAIYNVTPDGRGFVVIGGAAVLFAPDAWSKGI